MRYRDVCDICREPVNSSDGLHWAHDHGDAECGTGDGSTAWPHSRPPGDWNSGT